MNQNKRILAGIIAAVTMLILILDGKTSMQGATEGVVLCLYTVIPSLFPFIILSTVINSSLNGCNSRILIPLGNLCKLPVGLESLLVLGFLGGYPVGAEGIRQAYDRKLISKENATRMLTFCNNAGPAFIFGMTSQLFSSRLIPWIIWGIQIFSAIAVGVLIPANVQNETRPTQTRPLNFSKVLIRSIQVTALICGWVIIFKIILLFCEKWFLWFLPKNLQITFAGILEIVNGCTKLREIPSEGLRFILCSSFLAFGGLCVALQTATITAELGCKAYLKGKLLQCYISILCSCAIQAIIFNSEQRIRIPLIMPIISILLLLLTLYITSSKKLWIFKIK